MLVSTVPDEVTVSPPSEVAPASVYDEPSSTIAGLSPRIVITGKTVSGGVDESSVMSSRITTPSATSRASIIEISIALSDDDPAGTPLLSFWSSASWYEIKKSLLSIKELVL